MKEIPLSKGKVAVVDDEDFEKVNQFKWCAYKPNTSVWYGMRNEVVGYKKYKAHLLHRVIMDAPADKVVDHINGDGLDNRRANLRLCTRAENNRNVKLRRDTSSKWKGVYFHTDPRRTRPWQAYITVNGKRKSLGYFKTECDAGMAYNVAAFELHGAFARFNESPYN
jgi:hypothetical protein